MINKNFRGMKEYEKNYFKRNELGKPSNKNINWKGSKTSNSFNHSQLWGNGCYGECCSG